MCFKFIHFNDLFFFQLLKQLLHSHLNKFLFAIEVLIGLDKDQRYIDFLLRLIICLSGYPPIELLQMLPNHTMRHCSSFFNFLLFHARFPGQRIIELIFHFDWFWYNLDVFLEEFWFICFWLQLWISYRWSSIIKQLLDLLIFLVLFGAFSFFGIFFHLILEVLHCDFWLSLYKFESYRVIWLVFNKVNDHIHYSKNEESCKQMNLLAISRDLQMPGFFGQTDVTLGQKPCFHSQVRLHTMQTK